MFMDNDLCLPDYQHGFSSIPSQIRATLTCDSPKSVVLFLVDAFGWSFWQRFQSRYPILQHLSQNGTLTKSTAQFPSTTTAEITTLNTGLPVGAHGLYEWNYYEPKVDAVISPLLFSYAGPKERDTLVPSGIKPEEIYPTHTFYQDLAAAGIVSHTFMANEFVNSAYSQVLANGARRHGFDSNAERLKGLITTLINNQSTNYFYLYYGDIDATCHKHGPNSVEFEKAVDTFLNMLNEFFQQIEGKVHNTQIMLTADHGQTSVDPKTCVYINTEYRDLLPLMQTNKSGRAIAPGGSPRDLFLYIKPEHLDDVQDTLQNRLQDVATVRRTDQMVQNGCFGPQISNEFLSRLGNLVVLPHNHETVWWYEPDKFEQKYYGHHGGLTKDEMKIPLAVLSL